MYRDLAQWSGIRHQVLKKGTSIRQVARETGISRNTIRKILRHPLPQPYVRRYPKIGPHSAAVQRMLQEQNRHPPSAWLSVKAIYERIRDEDGFRGGYSTVKNYVRQIAPNGDGCIWEYAYDLLASLEKKRAIDFLFMLSREDPPVISPARTQQFFSKTGRVICITPKFDRRAQDRRVAFDWMRALLQKEIGLDTLRQEVGDVPDIEALVDHTYNGRLSDRNRSMAILGSSRGLTTDTVCSFLGIDRRTYRKYRRAFKDGGHAALFDRKIKATRKFDDEGVKQAVFCLLHEPPSNYGINRSTWIMRDLTRILRETGRPVCPGLIRKITKAAGYRWRKRELYLRHTTSIILRSSIAFVRFSRRLARTKRSSQLTSSAPLL